MLWGVMVLLALIAFAVYKKKSWSCKKGILWILSFSVLCPELCNEIGWISTEVGRQPWVVYGLLKTKDATSPIVNAGQIWQSLILFSIIFICLLSVFVSLLLKKIGEGPDEQDLIEVDL